MKKIFFKGYYGFQNLGDDLFVKSAEFLAVNRLNAVPHFVGTNLPKLSKKSKKSEAPNRQLARIYELCACIRADRIVIFGGSTIARVGGKLQLYHIISRFPFLYQKTSTIGTSVEIPGEEQERQRLVELLCRMQYVAVRDERSYREVTAQNVKCEFSFDPVIILSDVFPNLKDIKRDSGILGLCPCVNREEPLEEVEKRYEIFIKKIVTKCDIKRVRIFQFNGRAGEDAMFCKHLREFCREIGPEAEVIGYTKDSESMCAGVCKCAVVFGSRLHSGIVSYALGIPFMLEEYHIKCSDFLDTIGHRERFDPNDLDASAERFQRVWERKENEGIVNPDIFKEKFYHAVEEYKKSEQIINQK